MSTKISPPTATVKTPPSKTSSVGISSPVDCADEREAMPVNWARYLEWSSSFSHSYANRTLLYTQAQWVISDMPYRNPWFNSKCKKADRKSTRLNSSHLG